jgi:peptidoglycan-N-acetylglucosamine deacetylase
MRHISIYLLALATLFGIAALRPAVAEIEAGSAVSVDACASDPKRLGLSRIVEIDTTGGAVVGGERADSSHFLNDGEVVLTFDDGPIKATTSEVLKALAEQCTKATFFMVGRMALVDPEMVREVSAAGHTIGSHTWSHRNLRASTLVSARQEIESAISVLSKARGTPIAPLFRFPYLSSNRQTEAYLKSRNIGAVWVDIDSKDYLTRNGATAEKRIMAQLAEKKKGIILMHDIHSWTAKMLPDLLKDLRDHGFKVVHLVPKAPVETIAAFDASAEKAVAAKAAAKAANPLANRSIVWTLSPAPVPAAGAEASGADAKQNASGRARRISTRPTIAESIAGSEMPVPVSSRVKRAVKAKAADDPPWPNAFFSN